MAGAPGLSKKQSLRNDSHLFETLACGVSRHKIYFARTAKFFSGE
jgi:hypothetical protein